MAPRATVKAAKPKKAAARGVKTKGLKGTVATMPADKPGIGHNSGSRSGPSPEVRRLHHKAIHKAAVEMDKLVKEARSARSTYRDALKAAKKDGMDNDAIILARKWNYSEDHGEVHQRLANVATYLDDMKSPLAQLELFGDGLKAPTKEQDAYLQGEAAGKGGEPATNNPGTPGTDAFQKWADGWESGQGKLREGIGKSEGRTLN